MRLSVLYRQPLHEVLRWPAWEVDLLRAFLEREPAPEERIERLIAHLTAITSNVNRDPNKSDATRVEDLLPHRRAWVKEPPPGEDLTSDDLGLRSYLQSRARH